MRIGDCCHPDWRSGLWRVGMIVEIVPSSRIDMLAGLSRCWNA
jgi:hypothetical protein